ncbi:MAG: hypothetical protein J3R72DRAFT_178282 [Linnemannia gamsii]|nr:MAG: hypothetical protein J3R72DRAFT_178282 [Linnemannia gamsii]
MNISFVIVFVFVPSLQVVDTSQEQCFFLHCSIHSLFTSSLLFLIAESTRVYCTFSTPFLSPCCPFHTDLCPCSFTFVHFHYFHYFHSFHFISFHFHFHFHFHFIPHPTPFSFCATTARPSSLVAIEQLQQQGPSGPITTAGTTDSIRASRKKGQAKTN